MADPLNLMVADLRYGAGTVRPLLTEQLFWCSLAPH